MEIKIVLLVILIVLSDITGGVGFPLGWYEQFIEVLTKTPIPPLPDVSVNEPCSSDCSEVPFGRGNAPEDSAISPRGDTEK